MIRFLLIAIGLFFLGTPVDAAWHEASSDHFVIYADDSPEDLRQFADRLERYHAALSAQMRPNVAKPSPSNRVTVYVVRNSKDVQKLLGVPASSNIRGFYIPRAGGSFAIVPKLESSGSAVSMSEIVLFHEYAHHFMYGTSSVAFPRWFSEGFAEFYATSKFEKDGSVGLGLPANHRGAELGLAANVPLPLLLDTAGYLKKKSTGRDEFYGKSWGLFHYLRFDKDRKGQLAKYLTQVLAGKSELDAANESFGDLKLLERDLDRYLKQRRLHYIKLEASSLKVGDIQIRPLDAGQNAIMPLVIQSKRGVNDEQAKELVPQVRAVAAKFPQNAAVLSALAEAEFDSGNDEAAINAADRSLAMDASNVNALLQKAYAMERQAKNDKLPGNKPWSQVRVQFAKVNKVENDHPIPLMRYYMTFRENGDEPTKLAIEGLEWALTLAPFDPGLRLTVARQQIEDGRKDQAIATLQPLAYSPHESGLTKVAQEMIKRAQSGDTSNEDEDTGTAESE